MKKNLWLVILIAVLVVLALPIPTGTYKDGGTKEYTALTYKIVDWHRMTGDTIYDETRVYFFPYNFKSIDGLWYYEEDKVEHTFVATVAEINDSSVTVEPAENSAILMSADKVCFGISDLEKIDAKVGSVVKVTYKGSVMESYPAQVNAIRWELSNDLRHLEYTEQWLDKETAEKRDNDIFDHIVISKIYSNCFFANTVIPMPWQIKLNGTLSDDWCVGDQIICTYKNTYWDNNSNRIEADMLTVEASNWRPDPNACYKPVIYLYPEEATSVSVKLHLDGRLTCTYPAYNGGWNITAAPDGTLTDAKGQSYNYLYWEGQTNAQWGMTQGFCVKGADTAAFLETALEKLGLTRKEANEFIVYWLPLMEQNPYNIISFQESTYTDAAKLDISPIPDTLIRVFMTWQKSNVYVSIPAQTLTSPQRTGFTAVEWGGAEIK